MLLPFVAVVAAQLAMLWTVSPAFIAGLGEVANLAAGAGIAIWLENSGEEPLTLHIDSDRN
jgi:hypothetical protein